MSKILYAFIAVCTAFGMLPDSRTSGFRRENDFLQLALEVSRENHELDAAIAASQVSAGGERQRREVLTGNRVSRQSDRFSSRMIQDLSEDDQLNAAIAASLETAYREMKHDRSASQRFQQSTHKRSDKERTRELQAKAAEERELAFQNRGIGDKVKRDHMARRAASQGSASSAHSGRPQAVQASSLAVSANDPFVAKRSESSAVDPLFPRSSQASSASPLTGLQGGSPNTPPEIAEDLLAVPADVSTLYRQDDFTMSFMPSSTSGSRMGQDSREGVDVLAPPADVSALYRQDDFTRSFMPRSASGSRMGRNARHRVSTLSNVSRSRNSRPSDLATAWTNIFLA